MIFEHQQFFVNCIPKTGSKSLERWCDYNGMTIADTIDANKPIFAVMRNNRERIISGIAEDLYFLAHEKYNFSGTESLEDIQHLHIEVVEHWLSNPTHPISSKQSHYANLSLYFFNQIDLSTVNWIHINDINHIDKIINSVLSETVHLFPFSKEHDNRDTHRPPKEWYYELISKNVDVLKWIDDFVATEFNPVYIKL